MDDINFDEIEKGLGSISVKQSGVLNQLLLLAVHNNSLLRVILANQAKLSHSLDSSKSEDEYEKELTELAAELTLEKHSKILLKLSKSTGE